MPRYELVEGTSNKFWEIELKKASYTARWGRIGGAGHNEKTQTFPTAAEATKAHDKLVAEKLKKGYQLAGSKPAAKAKADDKLVNPKLEAGIADNPADVASWHVYADWLLENGAPWGEVIARACAKRTARQEQQLAEAAMLDGIAGTTMKWKYGAVESLELCPDEEYIPGTDPRYQGKKVDQFPMPLALGRVLAHPAGRLVRRLVLGLPPMVGGQIEWSFDSIIPVIAKHGPLPLLEAVDMSRDAVHMDQVSWRWVGDLRPLWKAAPRLKELRLMGSGGRRKKNVMGDIVAPHLETLVFESSGLDEGVPVDIGKAKLPALRELRLYFGRVDYGNTCTMKSLAGILAGKGLPKLETLGLQNSEWEADLIEAVAKSAILPRLEHLDLSMGVLYHDGPAALIKHAANFRHLKTLDLGDNYIDDVRALKAVLPNITGKYQREPEDEDEPDARYTSVGE